MSRGLRAGLTKAAGSAGGVRIAVGVAGKVLVAMGFSAACVSRMEGCRKLLEEAARALSLELASEEAGSALFKASAFLDFFGDIALGWQWLWQMTLAEQALGARLAAAGKSMADLDWRSPPDVDRAFYAGKVQTGRFYLERLLPVVLGKLECLKARGGEYLVMGADCF